MKISNRNIILTTVGVFAFFFIMIPYWIHTENGNQSVNTEDLIQINGSVETLRKTTTGGRHSKPIIYLKLSEHPYEFRIANSSYRAINEELAIKTLKSGTRVTIKTKIKEIKRSQSESILNLILKWRNQPLIYSLKTEHLSLLTIDQYNNQEEEFNSSNIQWGIILVLFVAGRLIWVDFQEKKVTVKK